MKNMKNQAGYTAPQLLVVLLWLAMVVGWIMNIITVVQMVSAEVYTGMLVLRSVGIILAPLGGVLGFIPS